MEVIEAVSLVGAAYELAVLVVNKAVGGCGGAVCALRGGVAHLNIASVNVGAPYFNRKLAAGAFCNDFNRQVTAVFEFELGTAPADRCVKTCWQVSDGEMVAVTGGDFEVCIKCGAVECGGNLADAAANFLHDLSACVCGSGLEACCGGALTYNIVVGEYFAGI